MQNDSALKKMEVRLTHISGRYADEEILAEARKTFPNSRLAMDFDHIVV